jgi:hypothetical protein
MRSRFVTVVLASVLAFTFAMAGRVSAEPGAQGSLVLRKVKHVIDGDGRVWLSVQFANPTTKTITVTSIGPSRYGPWGNVGRSVESGAAIKALMKIEKSEPGEVWIKTSEGTCVFELPKRE